MAASVTVEAKVLGQRKPLFSDWRIELPPEGAPAGGGLALRHLIERVVREEVRGFQERQEQRRLPRVLSREEIAAGALAGKVDPSGREAQHVTPEAAVATALEAFQDGVYYVFVDDAQVEDLDQEVRLRPDSRVTFLRLVPLAGG